MASGTTTRVSLASNALLLLGHTEIASFTENTTGATLASNLYETSYFSVLTTHRWRFATKKADLARKTKTPKNSYEYMFALPSDLLYLINTDTADYEVYGDSVYTNSATLSIDYIYKVKEDSLPPYFIKMFEFFLAAQFALPITGDLAKTAAMEKAYFHQLRLAKFADSSQRPADSFRSNPYVEARY